MFAEANTEASRSLNAQLLAGKVAGALPPDEQSLKFLLLYFDIVMDEHKRVENGLFPELRSRAGQRSLEIEALFAALLAEHAEIAGMWQRELRPRIQAMLNAPAGSTGVAHVDRERFAEFIELFRAHVDREERELMPFVRELLGTEDAPFCRPRCL